ncbi:MULTISPECIES: hypothetical protein [Halomonadaceae]|uniref:hypothetical protein n=1 Tax=Halomonadaceae TaxID=28256 RepID=UPI001866FA45|nr:MULTISPECIES: hypothetical protein [unclassified Halomonas]
MIWRNLSLFLVLFGLIAVAWLAYQRFPNIAYMVADYRSITGWAALRAGWPVYVLVVAVATLIGLVVGGWIGDTSRESDAAEALASQQRELAHQQRQAQQAEREAHDTAIAAAQAKRDAEALIGPSQKRINELIEENALLKRRLTGSIDALERKKRQLRAK